MKKVRLYILKIIVIFIIIINICIIPIIFKNLLYLILDIICFIGMIIFEVKIKEEIKFLDNFEEKDNDD